MKFTSEDLMKAMGLQVGDRIRVDNKIFEIYISPQNKLRCLNINNSNNHFYFKNLIDKDFEILPRSKRVGDLKCGDFKDCNKCPLVLCCDLIDGFSTKDTFDESLETLIIRDQEIYDLLKARLDKVVEE